MRELDFTQSDFQRVRELARLKAGITLAEHKTQLVYSRLARRLRCLGLNSFSDYLKMLDRDGSHPEWQQFVNALTTNLTGFYREPHHFQALAAYARTVPGPLSIWCCAASTGEEPYSIAMALFEALGERAARARILATDIDTDALAVARRGVYRMASVDKLDETRRRRFFYRGSGSRDGYVRIDPQLAAMIEFRQLNVIADTWPIDECFDVVFCRNLIIYFDAAAQAKLVNRIADVVRPGGLLFAGHSENLSRLTNAFELSRQTMYVRNPRAASAVAG